MAAKKKPAKKRAAKRAGRDQLHKVAQPGGLEEVAYLAAQGCSAQEISERLDTPIRTVYHQLAREDVQQMIAANVEHLRRTRTRVYQRHLETTRRQFEEWMAGKLELEDEAQKLAMLEYGRHLLGLGGGIQLDVADAGEQKALPAGGAAPLMPPGGVVHVTVYGSGESPKAEEAMETTARRVE